MPATFNQGFTVPVEFTLKTTKDGIRILANPIKEVDQLHDQALIDLAGEKAAQGVAVDAPDQEYDILVTLKKTGANRGCILSLGGRKVKLPAVTGDTMDFRVLVDRTTIEVVEEGGAAFRLEPRGGAMGKPVGKIEIKPEGGAVVEKVQIFKMKSALPAQEPADYKGSFFQVKLSDLSPKESAGSEERSYQGTFLPNEEIKGKITGDKITYELYLPPGYSKEKGPYPLIIHLHGAGGGMWSELMLPWYEAARKDGIIGDFIMVFPKDYSGTNWRDGTKKKPETNVVFELLPHLEETYSLTTDRKTRVIAGFSMGAYGSALWLAKYHKIFSVGWLMDPKDMNVTGGPGFQIPELMQNIDALRATTIQRVITSSGDTTNYCKQMDELKVPYSYARTKKLKGHSVICATSEEEGLDSWRFIEEHIGSTK